MIKQLLAPCRSFYRFFAIKIILSHDLGRAFWQTARMVASVVGLPLAMVALIGGTANLLCIPFVWVVNYLVAEKDLASCKQQMIEKLPKPLDLDAVRRIEEQEMRVQSVIRGHSWKAKLIFATAFQPLRTSINYKFSLGLWWAATPDESFGYAPLGGIVSALSAR